MSINLDENMFCMFLIRSLSIMGNASPSVGVVIKLFTQINVQAHEVKLAHCRNVLLLW